MREIFLSFVIFLGFSVPVNSSLTATFDCTNLRTQDLFEDFHLKSYFGYFYIEIVHQDPNPYDYVEISVQCTYGEATVSDWIFQEDATFVEYPYLYKLVKFSRLPTQCVISIRVSGTIIIKEYTILSEGLIQEGYVSLSDAT